MTAVVGNQQSPPSNETCISTPGLPVAPVDVTATVKSKTQVTVSWTDNTSFNPTRYVIYEAVVSGTSSPVFKAVDQIAVQQFPPTSVVIEGLTAGQTYEFEVQVDEGRTDSPLSSPSSAVTPGGSGSGSGSA